MTDLLVAVGQSDGIIALALAASWIGLIVAGVVLYCAVKGGR